MVKSILRLILILPEQKEYTSYYVAKDTHDEAAEYETVLGQLDVVDLLNGDYEFDDSEELD